MKASNFRSSEWLRRRWLDFRNGHGLYLIFAMAFLQFVVVTYTLAVERLSLLKDVFPSMWMWGVAFILAYMPAAVIIGHLHRKFQIPTETRQMMDANPFIYYVQPGREKLFNIPVNIFGLRVTMQGMKIQNAMADAVEKLSKETGTEISTIPRFDPIVFKEYEKLIRMYERLANGENILEILKDLKISDRPQSKEVDVERKDG